MDREIRALKKDTQTIKRTIVISGINLFEGGPLSIYKDCLKSIIYSGMLEEYHVIAFVHKRELFEEYSDKVELIEIPNSRKNYLYRIYYEYIFFYFYSQSRKIDVWFSIHDMTPNVKADKRYVYCHNPIPFLKRTKKIWKYSKTNYLMSIFYKYFYKINIKQNLAVIVQQEWIRNEFERIFKVKNVIVARPNISVPQYKTNGLYSSEKKVFIYAAFPRVFKNYEVICEAVELLDDMSEKFEVWLTIDGTENKYSADLKKCYSHNQSIKWLGLLDRDLLMKLYRQSDCMIFPSVLETWGLPITEYKSTGNPIIAADLPYAHETVGNYDRAIFFEPWNAYQLAEAMKGEIDGVSKAKAVTVNPIKEPVADTWDELWDILMRYENEDK